VRRILIDSGATYAFVTRTDAHHHRARTFVKAHLARQGVFVLVDAVFAETMTLLKARLGPALAIRVGRELRLNSVYQWIILGPEGERDTWATFEKYSDKQWSYTDCAVLVVAQRLKIPGVFSFDDHFTQMPFVARVPARA
jgi:predicted nucleic acid-binding protein